MNWFEDVVNGSFDGDIDIADVVFLVLAAAAKDHAEDLRDILNDVKKANKDAAERTLDAGDLDIDLDIASAGVGFGIAGFSAEASFDLVLQQAEVLPQPPPGLGDSIRGGLIADDAANHGHLQAANAAENDDGDRDRTHDELQKRANAQDRLDDDTEDDKDTQSDHLQNGRDNLNKLLDIQHSVMSSVSQQGLTSEPIRRADDAGEIGEIGGEAAADLGGRFHPVAAWSIDERASVVFDTVEMVTFAPLEVDDDIGVLDIDIAAAGVGSGDSGFDDAALQPDGDPFDSADLGPSEQTAARQPANEDFDLGDNLLEAATLHGDSAVLTEVVQPVVLTGATDGWLDDSDASIPEPTLPDDAAAGPTEPITDVTGEVSTDFAAEIDHIDTVEPATDEMWDDLLQ